MTPLRIAVSAALVAAAGGWHLRRRAAARRERCREQLAALLEGERLGLSLSESAPGLLLIAADRDALEAALAAAGEPAPPLPPAIFGVTPGGLRRES